jgi:N6-adenosine-specific RNA methylase IME4
LCIFVACGIGTFFWITNSGLAIYSLCFQRYGFNITQHIKFNIKVAQQNKQVNQQEKEGENTLQTNNKA